MRQPHQIAEYVRSLYSEIPKSCIDMCASRREERGIVGVHLAALDASSIPIRDDGLGPLAGNRLQHPFQVLQQTLRAVAEHDGQSPDAAKWIARSETAAVAKAVSFLTQLDPRGVALRYTAELPPGGHSAAEPQPTIPESFWLALPETIDALEAAAEVLEGADSYLQVWIEIRAEMAHAAVGDTDLTADV